MTHPTPDRTRQIAAYLDGVLDPAALSDFSDWLNADDANARQLVEQMLLESHLRRSNTELKKPSAGASATPLSAAGVPMYRKGYEPQPFRVRPHHVALIAATLLAACGLAIYVYVSSLPQSPIPDPTSPPPVATLIGSTDTVVVDNNIGNPGSDYAAGSYSIESGSAQFMLIGSDVDVRLTGNTRLRIHHKMASSLTRGSATFRCPPQAKGYTVHLPGNVSVVDLGTEFRVAIDEQGRTVCTVINGSVELVTANPAIDLAGSPRLAAGEAIRWIDGRFTRLPAVDVVLSEAPFNGNLIVNGDFESGPSTFTTDPPETKNIAIQGWTDTTRAVAVTYESGLKNNYPNPQMTTLPDDPGERYFLGLYEGTITQDIELDNLAGVIDAGLVRYDLSGWLGGYAHQADSAQLTIHFRDEDGDTLSSASLGPVTADDRSNRTGFVRRDTSAVVPSGTRSVHVELRGIASSGAVDAYADNLSLTLHPVSPAESIAETPLPQTEN